jgi:hypothetical protein
MLVLDVRWVRLVIAWMLPPLIRGITGWKRLSEPILPTSCIEVLAVKDAANEMGRGLILIYSGLQAVNNAVIADLQRLPVGLADRFNR